MKKNVKAFALAGIGAVALVGGTFAYYNSTQTFENNLDTGKYGASATEKFNPDDGHNWKPGVEVDKEIYATNTGDGEVWVRIRFDETWMRNNTSFIEFGSHEGKFNPKSSYAGNHQIDTVRKDDYLGDVDGMTDKKVGEGSVVYKKFENLVSDNKPNSTANSQKWYYEDGYYYYTTSLQKNTSTQKLLDSITLCKDTDMGRYNDKSYYTISDVELDPLPVYPSLENETRYTWVEGTLEGQNTEGKYVYIAKASELDETYPGYANADYTLNITTEFVQANSEAAENLSWGWYPGKN